MEADSMVTNGARKTQTPFTTLRAVSGVEQITHWHNFVVNGSWNKWTWINYSIIPIIKHLCYWPKKEKKTNTETRLKAMR